jgi:hypothetical protein
MASNFQFYRILCITPPDLEAERLAVQDAVAEFNERVAMPDRVLFALASLRPPFRAAAQKHAIENNIEACEFVVQIYGEQLPEPVFQEFAVYAFQCVADPSKATRDVAVLFRNYETAAPELRQFRETLPAGAAGELREELSELLTRWYALAQRKDA